MKFYSARRTMVALTATGFLTLGAILPLGLAHAAPPTPDNPAGNILGVIPVRGAFNAAKVSASSAGNLLYHSGGSVQTGTHQTYAIYWGSDFSYNGVSGTASPNGYQTLINAYFGNVAADSVKIPNTSNVYYSDTQYYQNIGTTTHVQYSEQFSGTWSDTMLPASNGCTSTAGGSVACVSDAQVQAEVAKAILTNHWPTGMGAEYFVYLANGVSTCAGSSCFVSSFCAYHSHYADSSGQTVLYANMPFTGYQLSSCSGATGTPNNNAAADATLSTTSHEANETITDPLGNAWYDRRGNENGDKCAYNYGTQLGANGSGNYNQSINGTTYELQQEWSNRSSGCVLTGV